MSQPVSFTRRSRACIVAQDHADLGGGTYPTRRLATCADRLDHNTATTPARGPWRREWLTHAVSQSLCRVTWSQPDGVGHQPPVCSQQRGRQHPCQRCYTDDNGMQPWVFSRRPVCHYPATITRDRVDLPGRASESLHRVALSVGPLPMTRRNVGKTPHSRTLGLTTPFHDCCTGMPPRSGQPGSTVSPPQTWTR